MNGALRIGLLMQGGAGWMGGSEYIKNLAQAISTTGLKHSLTIFSGSPIDEAVRAALPDTCRVIDLPPRSQGRVSRLLRLGNRRFAAAVRSAGIDFLYPFTYDNEHNLGVSFPLGSALRPSRWAGWIPDFQHRHLPEFFSTTEIKRREQGITALGTEADLLIFSSAACAADYRRFFPDNRARVEVLRFCSAPAPEWLQGNPAAVQARYYLPDRFFLLSNQFWQHKNHLLVFAALGVLAQRGERPHVVCTGHPADFRDKNYFSLVLQRLHQAGVANQVSLLGLIPREDQIQLMRRSIAVLQPSLCEGWSTVVEDARLLGKTVVLSDLEVHREQNPPGARFFERASAESLASALSEAWRDGTPGPDRAREFQAQSESSRALAAFGARFLELAQPAPTPPP